MLPLMTRRQMLCSLGNGFGALGLASMLAGEGLLGSTARAAISSASNPLAPKAPHFPPRAKRVIFLFMHGGPSSIDTFDPKPRLDRDNGKPVPFKRGLTFGEDGVRGLMKSPWNFRQYGKSGIPVSDLFPHVGACADDLC